MTTEPKRDWTQSDILAETRKRHTGHPGFFNTLHDVCEEAFAGHLADPMEADLGDWEFSVGDIPIGQLIDFFAEHERKPAIKWHNESGGPGAYIVIDDRDLAAEFCLTFGRDWATEEERQRRGDEDAMRASRG